MGHLTHKSLNSLILCSDTVMTVMCTTAGASCVKKEF